jgi:hypothetical protein
MLNLDILNAYRDATIDKKDAALKHYRNSIAQVIRVKLCAERLVPDSGGTATLLRVGKRSFIVTAAHVIDAAKESSIYLGIGKRLFPLEGNAFVTKSSNREDDVFDFAFLEAPVELSENPDVRFLNTRDFYFGESEKSITSFMAYGFPRSKNKKVDIPKKIIRNRSWSFTSTESDIDLSQFRASDQTHIAIKFTSRKFVTESGSATNVYSPRGLSGGPLLKLGNPGNPDYYRPIKKGQDCSAKLSGILIEHRSEKNVVIAVRLSTVLTAIAKQFPELSRSLPSQISHLGGS